MYTHSSQYNCPLQTVNTLCLSRSSQMIPPHKMFPLVPVLISRLLPSRLGSSRLSQCFSILLFLISHHAPHVVLEVQWNSVAVLISCCFCHVCLVGWGRGGLSQQAYPARWGRVGSCSGETGHCPSEAGGSWEGRRWEREVCAPSQAFTFRVVLYIFILPTLTCPTSV